MDRDEWFSVFVHIQLQGVHMCCRVSDLFVCIKDQSFLIQFPVFTTTESTSSGSVNVSLYFYVSAVMNTCGYTTNCDSKL